MHNFKLQSSNRNENITHTKSEQQQEEEMKNKQTNEKKNREGCFVFFAFISFFSLPRSHSRGVCVVFVLYEWKLAIKQCVHRLARNHYNLICVVSIRVQCNAAFRLSAHKCVHTHQANYFSRVFFFNNFAWTARETALGRDINAHTTHHGNFIFKKVHAFRKHALLFGSWYIVHFLSSDGLTFVTLWPPPMPMRTNFKCRILSK